MRERTLEFCNEMFNGWFENASQSARLEEVFPELELKALTEQLDNQGSYNHEVQFRRKRRTLVISLNFRLTEIGTQSVLVLECNNISRIRELESMIESYSRMVERNAREIQREKEQVEKLLLNLMPRSAYEELRDFGTVAPQRYESVALLELRFINFEEKVEQLAPADLISELNEIHSACDCIAEQLGCERIRTTGDSYRCVLGMDSGSDDKLLTIARTATRFQRYLRRRNAQSSSSWLCKIGIGEGACVGSVVGSQKYVYDMFGDAVKRTESALTSAGEMQIVAAVSAESTGLFSADDLQYETLSQNDVLHMVQISEAEKHTAAN
jgi:class 3 adenylate cyclase